MKMFKVFGRVVMEESGMAGRKWDLWEEAQKNDQMGLTEFQGIQMLTLFAIVIWHAVRQELETRRSGIWTLDRTRLDLN